MHCWPSFSGYDLSHLNASVINVSRAETETHPTQTYRIFVKYSDHCFTGHYGEVLYPHSRHERYFCSERYGLSLELPGLMTQMFDDNVMVGMTFNQHREQFFHLEANFLGVSYRVFFELAKSNHPQSDLRMTVVSAHPETESYGSPVAIKSRWKLWSIADAKHKGTPLRSRTSGRRGSRGR